MAEESKKGSEHNLYPPITDPPLASQETTPMMPMTPITPIDAGPAPGFPVPLGPDSARLTCPSCHAVVTSQAHKVSTRYTHLFAVLACLFVMWPVACAIYCCNCCMATNHYCPECNAFLGVYNPMTATSTPNTAV